MLNNPRSLKGLRFASGTLDGTDPHMLGGGFVGPPVLQTLRGIMFLEKRLANPLQ